MGPVLLGVAASNSYLAGGNSGEKVKYKYRVHLAFTKYKYKYFFAKLFEHNTNILKNISNTNKFLSQSLSRIVMYDEHDEVYIKQIVI